MKDTKERLKLIVSMFDSVLFLNDGEFEENNGHCKRNFLKENIEAICQDINEDFH